MSAVMISWKICNGAEYYITFHAIQIRIEENAWKMPNVYATAANKLSLLHIACSRRHQDIQVFRVVKSEKRFFALFLHSRFLAHRFFCYTYFGKNRRMTPVNVNWSRILNNIALSFIFFQRNTRTRKNWIAMNHGHLFE